MPGLGRRLDDLGVVAVRKHRASTTLPRSILADRSIEVLGRRDLKALHSRRQRALVVGLDEQMQMIALDAEVHDPEVLASRGRQRRLAHCFVCRAAAQVVDVTHDAQDHVHRVPRLQLGPRPVR